MTNLIAAILFLTLPSATNAPVLNDAGFVRGWNSSNICHQADVTLTTNGFWLLQWSEAAEGRPWIGAAMIDGSITATNGVIFYQLQNIPTNSIPASSALVTNYVTVNLTNTIGGGGKIDVATNYTAAGSFVLCKYGVTTYWP